MHCHTKSLDITILESFENGSKLDYELIGIKHDMDDCIST